MTTKVELNFAEWFKLAEGRGLRYKRERPSPPVDRSVDSWIDAVEKLKDDIRKLKDELSRRDREEKSRPKPPQKKKSPLTKVPGKKKDEEPDDDDNEDADDNLLHGSSDRPDDRIRRGRLLQPEVPGNGRRGRKPVDKPDPKKYRKRRQPPDGDEDGGD